MKTAEGCKATHGEPSCGSRRGPAQAGHQVSALLEKGDEVLARAYPNTWRLEFAPLDGSCAQHLHWSLLASSMRWIAVCIIAYPVNQLSLVSERLFTLSQHMFV
jgi:hypothetical protein